MCIEKYLHPGWTCPSKASLRMTSPPTWRCRSSTRRSPRWTSCKRWPLVPSTSPGSSHPEWEREKGAQCQTSGVRNSSWFARFYSRFYYASTAAPAIDCPSKLLIRPAHQSSGSQNTHMILTPSQRWLPMVFALHTSTDITFSVSSPTALFG